MRGLEPVPVEQGSLKCGNKKWLQTVQEVDAKAFKGGEIKEYIFKAINKT